MDKKLEAKLVKEFPLLYSDYGGAINKTCMHWGFECDDGWYDLIHGLSVKLEAMITIGERDHKPDGYHPRAAQIKEKYGELCFYMTSASDKMYDAINAAEDASYAICEVCGKVGKPTGSGWLKTLCDQCAKKRNTETRTWKTN